MVCVNMSGAALDDFAGPLLSVPYIYLTCHWLGFAVCALWLVMLGLFLKSTADEFLSPVMVILCDLLSLDAQVAGATLLAFGNGAPDVFAAVAAFTNSKSNADLGLGSLLGGASFVTTVVLGAVLMSCPDGVEVRLDQFGRDAFFLLFAVGWLVLLSLSSVGASVATSAVFLVIYGLYVGLIVWQSRASAKVFGPSHDEEEPLLASDPVAELHGALAAVDDAYMVPKPVATMQQQQQHETPPPVTRPGHFDAVLNDVYWRTLRAKSFVARESDAELLRLRDMFVGWRVLRMLQTPLGVLRALTIPIPEEAAWNKTLVAAHPPLCALLVMHVTTGLSHASVVLPVLLVSLLVSCAATLSFQDARPPSGWCRRLLLACVSFVMCVMWIYVVAGEFVALLDAMGVVVGANRSLLGLSLLAWGNSLGDLFNNVSVAKAGYAPMGVAACVAGPVFNLLLGLGASMMVLTGRMYPHSVAIVFDKYTITACALLFGVMLAAILFLVLGFRKLGRCHALLLFLAYGVYTVAEMFLIW